MRGGGSEGSAMCIAGTYIFCRASLGCRGLDAAVCGGHVCAVGPFGAADAEFTLATSLQFLPSTASSCALHAFCCGGMFRPS